MRRAQGAAAYVLAMGAVAALAVTVKLRDPAWVGTALLLALGALTLARTPGRRPAGPIDPGRQRGEAASTPRHAAPAHQGSGPGPHRTRRGC